MAALVLERRGGDADADGGDVLSVSSADGDGARAASDGAGVANDLCVLLAAGGACERVCARNDGA